MSRDHVQSINFDADGVVGRPLRIAEGPIGWKLNRLHGLLDSLRFSKPNGTRAIENESLTRVCDAVVGNRVSIYDNSLNCLHTALLLVIPGAPCWTTSDYLGLEIRISITP